MVCSSRTDVPQVTLGAQVVALSSIRIAPKLKVDGVVPQASSLAVLGVPR